MEKMKYQLINMIALIFLSFTKFAWAETDLLNLSNYVEESSPSYGENVVIKQDEKTGIKWITQGLADSAGKLKFPVNLSDEFELLYEVESTNSMSIYGSTELFLTADEYKIRITVTNLQLYAGNEDSGRDQSNAAIYGKNTYKLSVSNNVARLYINDVFSHKITLKPDLIYTQLLIQKIDKYQQVYALKVVDSSDSTQLPVTGSGDFDSGKQAGIQQCVSDPVSCGISVTSGTCTGGTHATYSPTSGEVYIPFIDVPDPFGGTQTYEVYLIQQPLTFVFDLDINRIHSR